MLVPCLNRFTFKPQDKPGAISGPVKGTPVCRPQHTKPISLTGPPFPLFPILLPQPHFKPQGPAVAKKDSSFSKSGLPPQFLHNLPEGGIYRILSFREGQIKKKENRRMKECWRSWVEVRLCVCVCDVRLGSSVLKKGSKTDQRIVVADPGFQSWEHEEKYLF